MDYDLSIIVPFISDKLSPNIFKYAYFVNEMIDWNDWEEKITNRSYRDLKQSFFTEEYSLFCKLDWNKLSDKYDLESNNWSLIGLNDFISSKIRENFIFNEETEINKLLKIINNIQSIKEDNFLLINNSMDIVIKENFIQNPEMGFKLLKRILNNYPLGLQLLYRSFGIIIKESEQWSLKLWNELEKWENENSLFWRINFFNYLPDSYVNESYCIRLFTTIKSIDKPVYLNLYSKFNLIDKHISKNILEIIANKIDKLNITITYSSDVFEKNIELFENDYELIKRSYFQQYKVNDSSTFDCNKGFEKIFDIYPEFLKDFVQKCYIDHSSSKRNARLNLNFIWNNNSNLDIIEETINLIIDKKVLGIGNYSINIFFNKLNDEQLIIALEFIKQYLEKYKNEHRKVNLIFDTIRSCFSTSFEELVLYFLEINSQIEIFEKISWVGRVGVQRGRVNFEELYLKKWEAILNIVDKSNDRLGMIPIRLFLKNKITKNKKRVE